MTSTTTKSIPFAVLVIIVGTLAFEAYSGTNVDLEEFLPLLIAMGIGGVPLSVLKKAIDAKKAIPKPVEDEIKQRLKKKIDEA